MIRRTVVESSGHLHIGLPKTDKSIRTLIISPSLITELKTHIKRFEVKGNKSYMFTDSKGGLVRRSNYRRRVFIPATERAGLGGLTFHGLRHSAATEWIAAGVDAKTVQHKLGHTDPRLTLELYAHHSSEAEKRATETLDEIYWKN